MWKEFFKFDLRYQLRQPLLWVVAFVLAALAFGAATSDEITVGSAIGNVNRNAPVVIVQFLAMFSQLSMFVVTIFIAGAVLRDSEIGISDMIFATPMRKLDYLMGRFLAGMGACLMIFLIISIGIMLGPLMPWVDSARVGPFLIQPFIYGIVIFVLPNLLFMSGLLMLLAATTRSIIYVYVGVIAFFVLSIMARVLTRDVNNEWLASLIDPFGMSAFGRMTRYFTVQESNTILPSVSNYLLVNRLLWSAVALLMFAATVFLFKPQRAGTGRRWFGKAVVKTAEEPGVIVSTVEHMQVDVVFSPSTAWKQCWSILFFDAKAIFKSAPFLVILMFGMMNFIAGASLGGKLYGTNFYPVTRQMLETLSGSFNFLLIVIVTFYAGELIFKERQAKIAEVINAMPMPNWVPLAAKCTALVGIVISFMTVGALVGMCIQLVKGGTTIEGLLYVKGVLLGAMPFVLMGLFAIGVQVIFNNKFIGYLLMILLFVSLMLTGMMHFEHNLYNFAGLPAIQYSDMNGYGHFLTGWSWFAVYWSLFVVALLIIAAAFWERTLSPDWRARMRLAVLRLKAGSGIALALSLSGFAMTGAWIFYNTNVLNKYIPSDVEMDNQASYEKNYRQYKDLPQLKVIDVKAEVDIFPAERRVAIQGHYVLQNKTALPLDTLRIQHDPRFETKWLNLPQHQTTLEDKELGFMIVKLAQSIAPGANLALDFSVSDTHQGFTNSGKPDRVNLNGTFISSDMYFPHFGYSTNMEMQDRYERRKRGLGEPDRANKLENVAALVNHVGGQDSDWVNFDTTVSTSADQIALAPGYLQKTWTENGRRYFHYKMDKPGLFFFSYQSANWEVKKGDWHGMPIEIYYDKKHPYNVDRMIYATQKSLDYYTQQFTPYEHHQVRILEFPRYERFAQSFANTVPFSEEIGFIADLRNKDDIDYVYYVTAHEVAHQWWAHQVIGADVQGATMLMESMAQYSALMVMEKEYGREKMRRFLRQELDTYLQGRGGEKIEELPLNRVENQPYIHYRKGALIFYRLRDEIGEEPLNRALKRYLQDKAFQQAPYTTSLELLDYIRAETPPEKQALITDLFEKIVIYDNRVTEATTVHRPDGQWDVTMKLHLAKMEVDGKGKETPRIYDEPAEIAVFSRAKGADEKDEKVLYIAKRVLQGSDPVVTVTVKEQPFEVGVDPYNKLIDRVPGDNRKEVSLNEDGVKLQ
ncbi:ABC transporter permease/M1 family aminopeptidase [Solimicrobium silvestre]|uniref:Peptidase family M1 n=1 Tax=Solimicrobium silvestre TaxID=2099400 RepID=A0A2S9GZT2_9BURK|nr:M1 family aminopeptidase [Solimicrobium silvestre]PRC93245.1 Peptidase family M1 [Solimicrobium silvestre]